MFNQFAQFIYKPRLPLKEGVKYDRRTFVFGEKTLEKRIVPKYERPRTWSVFRILLNSQMRIIKHVIQNTIPNPNFNSTLSHSKKKLPMYIVF